jgi:hypothetical protein
MKCGHAIHRDCWEEHIKTGYKCPICNKSVVNMETQFRNLDMAIQTQPMPEKFQDTRALVLCNDCSARTTVSYHWLGLKCAVCHSYNTSQLQIMGLGVEHVAPATTTTTTTATDINIHGTQPSESPLRDIPDASRVTGTPAARDIPMRRRHSSNAMHTNIDTTNSRSHQIGSYVVQDRLARSASPSQTVAPAVAAVAELSDVEDFEDEDEDIIGLWRHAPRSITSDDGQHDRLGSEEDSLSSMSDETGEDEDEEDDEEDEIFLLGHR